jgi:3'-5' exonuclease
MMRLFLDIETIPALDPAVRDRIAATIRPPSNMTKAETIARWEADEKPGAIETAWRRTALDAASGHVAVIGFALDDDPPETYVMPSLPRVNGDGIAPGIVSWPAFEDAHHTEHEAAALYSFFLGVYRKAQERGGQQGIQQVVGHNVLGFDLRFLWQRCCILRVEPPVWFERALRARPWTDEVFDTMLRFAGDRGTISFDTLCRALGMPGKPDDIDGSRVWDHVRDGMLDRVESYCRQDVADVRQVWKRLSFIRGA